VLSDKSTILTPLTDAKKEEEREVALYTIPFVPNLDMEGGTPIKKTPVKRKQQERATKGKQVVDIEATPEDVDIIWKETFQSDIALDFNDPIMREKIASLTNKLAEKV
jgi:hypothetical protein